MIVEALSALCLALCLAFAACDAERRRAAARARRLEQLVETRVRAALEAHARALHGRDACMRAAEVCERNIEQALNGRARMPSIPAPVVACSERTSARLFDHVLEALGSPSIDLETGAFVFDEGELLPTSQPESDA